MSDELKLFTPIKCGSHLGMGSLSDSLVNVYKE